MRGAAWQGPGEPDPRRLRGRTGGGEEKGAIRGVGHHVQRFALHGSPRQLSTVIGRWLPGTPQIDGAEHPFRKRCSALEIGYTLRTASRVVTLEDIEHLANFTGDTFYRYTDEEVAKTNPFPRAASRTAMSFRRSRSGCSSIPHPPACSQRPASIRSGSQSRCPRVRR